MISSQHTSTEPQPAPAVALSELTKLFGRFAALRGVSAEFGPGRLYVVLGDNGAGKSTLLRAIAGLMRPSRGRVRVLGSADLRSRAAEIGYMAHAPLLYDELDGMENLRYFARLYGLRGDERCAEVMRAIGLDPALPRRVGQYSQGMRQRLSLARAILNNPTVVLLDEPFSNVDIVSAREMVRLLGEMRDAGKTVFVVTHQPALLEGVADETVTMNAGQIVAREQNPHPVPPTTGGTRVGQPGREENPHPVPPTTDGTRAGQPQPGEEHPQPVSPPRSASGQAPPGETRVGQP